LSLKPLTKPLDKKNTKREWKKGLRDSDTPNDIVLSEQPGRKPVLLSGARNQ
jgi:hypothetical protein